MSAWFRFTNDHGRIHPSAFLWRPSLLSKVLHNPMHAIKNVFNVMHPPATAIFRSTINACLCETKVTVIKIIFLSTLYTSKISPSVECSWHQQNFTFCAWGYGWLWLSLLPTTSIWTPDSRVLTDVSERDRPSSHHRPIPFHFISLWHFTVRDLMIIWAACAREVRRVASRLIWFSHPVAKWERYHPPEPTGIILGFFGQIIVIIRQTL